MAKIPSDELAATTLQLHPAVQIIHSRWPLASIRQATINPAFDSSTVNMNLPECVLVVRPEYDVHVHRLLPSSVQFLNALKDGFSIEAAALVQLNGDPAFDTGSTLSQLLQLGAFSGICSSRSCD